MDKFKIFYENKDILINCGDYETSLFMLNEIKNLTSDKIQIKLLESLIDKKRYNKPMELEKFKIYLDIIDIIYYRNDSQKIIDDIQYKFTDVAQLNTLQRIILKKPMRRNDYICQEYINQDLLIKNCPHCQKEMYSNLNNKYVICGYSSSTKGFDWKGCGKDWCFECGKKLCKKWEVNMLFNRLNRYHDSRCCKYFALKTSDNYLENFCMCRNENVDRIK